NLTNLGDRKVAFCLGHFAWFVVDNPVTDTGLDTPQILAGELILFRRTIVVDRVRPMNEYAKSHSFFGQPLCWVFVATLPEVTSGLAFATAPTPTRSFCAMLAL